MICSTETSAAIGQLLQTCCQAMDALAPKGNKMDLEEYIWCTFYVVADYQVQATQIALKAGELGSRREQGLRSVVKREWYQSLSSSAYPNVQCVVQHCLVGRTYWSAVQLCF